MRSQARALIADPSPPFGIGVFAAAAVVALSTALLYPLREVAPVVSLGVVYLPAVLLVSAIWDARLGIIAALLAATAYNFFHIPPVGEFTIADSENWVALGAFLAAAVLASSVAQIIRRRSAEVDQRRREADLGADMARILLRSADLEPALRLASERLATALDLESAAIELGRVESSDRRTAFPLRDGPRRIGTLVVPASTDEATLRRLQERVVPSLEALLSSAQEQAELQGAAVEASALRRVDSLKTAILRSVSHDLRSPLTAISAAADSVASPSLSQPEREELAAVIQQEGRRLTRLVDDLLDLSRLQTGAAEPRADWTSLGELVEHAIDGLQAPPGAFDVSLEPDLPMVRSDAAQLERAIANVLDNGLRHSGGEPVSIRARRSGSRVLLRVVDHGPGIRESEREKIFEPFYTADEGPSARGSGLGLAITKGFVEANGGRVSVESLPAQGTAFVFELPVPAEDGAEVPAPVE